MSDVKQLKFPDLPVTSQKPNLADGGGPPHDVVMESRLTALETRLDTILPTLATREDMHKIDASIKAWMIATIIALFIGFAGLFFTLSNSIRSGSQAASQPPAPTIIQVPAYPAPYAPAPQPPKGDR